MLLALKFPLQFIKWIVAYVTSVTFTIHINGQDNGVFQGGKGLRQGDLLSPLLFVICMEYLSRLLHRVSLEPNFRYHPNCKQLGLTHLMSADDLILFCKTDLATLQHIMNVLHEFHECAGLQANMQKSQMVLGGCSPDLQYKCQQITGLQDSNFPLKYLGVPITSSRLTKVACRNLVEKITVRMKIWATKSLSYAGRVMLINTVVFGMFNYWASIFILATEVVSKRTQLCRKLPVERGYRV